MFKKLLLTSCLIAFGYFANAQLRMTNFASTAPLGFNTDGGVAEITAFDPITNQLFCINGVANQVAVYDFSTPAQGAVMNTISTFSIPSGGAINSIACYKGLLAVVYENQTDRTLNGLVQLYTTSGLAAIGSPIQVGAQPDMITFTPDGKKLLIANEGEPNNFYTVDPEGSITIIDVTNPFSPTTQQVSLTSLNGTVPHLSTQPTVTPSVRIFGMINSLETTVAGFATSNTKTPSTVAQDLEPEYITISPDGNTAWVTCQENNAVLIINIPTASVVTLVGLGYKNHNTVGNGMDISRTPTNTAAVNITTWPFRGMYQPDGISVLSVSGIPYLFTANEGDARAYTGFNEEIDANASGFGARINNGASLSTIQAITTAGIRFTNATGNTNGGNSYMANSVAGANINVGNNFEELFTYGTRSFSVWNGLTGALVWDSGDQFERQTFAAFPNNFNADHNGGSSNNVRRRSTTKGPEPESIVTDMIGDSLYAFIGLERIGGVMVYNVTNPIAPYFRQYINTRSFVNPATAAFSVTGNDLGPEGLTIFEDVNGDKYLVVSNEISGTLRIFKLEYSKNIASNNLTPFVIPANDNFSTTQVVTLRGSNLTSPLNLSVIDGFFNISLSSTSGFTFNLSNITFSGSDINLPVFIRAIGTGINYTDKIAIGDASGNFSDINLSGTKISVNTIVGTSAFTLQLLHASDFEAGLAAMDNAPRFAAIWDKFNNDYPNTLRVSGGDNFLPSPFFNAAADATLRNTFANINNGLLGGTNGANHREGIGRGDIQFMNLLDLHASAIGNHEFDAGTGTFLEMIGIGFNDAAAPTQIRWSGTRFPYLSCNLDFSADAGLSPLYTNEIRNSSTYKVGPSEAQILALTANQRRKIAPATVVTIGGETIGIVGATTQIVSRISSTGLVSVIGTNVDNMPLLASQIQVQVDRLRGMGINKIVLLAHLQQIANEKALAPLLSGVDIIVAAGSHTLMADNDDNLEGDIKADHYPFTTTGIDGGNTLIVSTSSEYSYVGRLVIDFDANGNVILSSYNSAVSGAWKATDAGMVAANVTLNTVFSGTNRAQLAKGLVEGINASIAQPNAITLSGVTATLVGIRGVINTQDGNIFGKTQVFMEGRREGVRQQETNLGNVTSDANLWYARNLGHNVQVSLKNGGGIRASLGVVSAVGSNFVNLPPLANPSAGKLSGEISQLDIANALRFNNGLSVITVTAAQLLQVMNHSVAASTPTATPGQFAQHGGMRYSYNLTNPIGSRVRSLAIVDSLGNVTDVIATNGSVVGNAMRTIGMVTLNFMVTGGDSYPFPAFQTANPTLFNRTNLYAGNPTSFAFTDLGSEQQGFARYLQAAYPRTSAGYNIMDTPASQDLRSQNMAVRTEQILPSFIMPISQLNGLPNSVVSLNNISIAGRRLATNMDIVAPTNVTINGGSMASLSSVGGILNLSFTVPTAAGNNLFNISVVAANFVIVFPYSVNVIGNPFTTTVPSYILTTAPGAQFTPLISVGENINGYNMVGIPDGTGAFDNNDGTFSYFVNHELGTNAGIVRAHGARGAFVSKWIIRKSDLKILSGQDLIRNVYLWNGAGYNLFNSANTTSGLALGRFCSADLPDATAFYNSVTGKGSMERIFMNGEEIGSEGRGFAHILTGSMAGSSFELPYLGKFSYENAIANPFTQDKTIVVGTDDATPGQVYVYIGTKQNTGSEIEKAGLSNGKLFGIAVNGIITETNTTFPASATGFSMVDLGQVQNLTGSALNTLSNNNGVTNFLRPEDGAWDPKNPNDLYFVTTNSITSPSRLYRARFTDITNPELGGTIEALLDGTEGPKMMDNIGIDTKGRILIQEDPGNNPYLAKIWEYTIATDKIRIVAEHDPARFLTGSPNFMTEDEESSGIIDAEHILGPGMFLLSDQIHKGLGGELVEEGQLLAFHLPIIPTVTFNGITMTVGGANVDLSTLLMSNSTGTKSFMINGLAATISGNVLTAVAQGSVTITGTVASTSGFNAGMATAIFTVVTVPSPIVKVNPSITFTGTTLTIGGANVNLASLFSTNSDGTPLFVIAGTSASLSGTNLVGISAGTVTVTSSVASTAGFNAASQTAVFTIVAGITPPTSLSTFQSTSFTIYPNPVLNGVLYFTKTITGTIVSLAGTEQISFTNATQVDVSKLSAGTYIVKTATMGAVKFVIK